MKRKITKLLLLICLIFALPVSILPMTARAETFTGKDGWGVTFTQDEKMVSNFKTSELTDLAKGLQPGDKVIVTLKLTNEYTKTIAGHKVMTDWYMRNLIIDSLEDSSKASGGAYTYKLTYKGNSGERTLYDSEAVGGEVQDGSEGLHEATNALDESEYLWLDTLGKGESGELTLIVALEGETQGNDYQDTAAKLQLDFAVELEPVTTEEVPGEPTEEHRTRIVRTGDPQDVLPYVIATAVSGLFLLVLGAALAKKRQKTIIHMLLAVLMFASLLSGVNIRAQAADTSEEGYTYKIRIFAGAQGTFKSGGTVIEQEAKYGQQFVFNAVDNVKLNEGSEKFYVRGIMLSGRDYKEDNVTDRQAGFTVTGDTDLVVSYGIKGEGTEYTVNYVDQNGNPIPGVESRTYYGNVGDRPVIAYLYIEGYEPTNALNLTRTLQRDASKNIFTFEYRPSGTTVQIETEGGTTIIYDTVTETATGGGGGTGAGTGAAGTPGGGAAGAAEGATGEGNPAGLIDLDTNEEVPLEQQQLDNNEGNGDNGNTEPEIVEEPDAQAPTGFMALPTAAKVGIGAGAAALIAIIAAALLGKKKKNDSEE